MQAHQEELAALRNELAKITPVSCSKGEHEVCQSGQAPLRKSMISDPKPNHEHLDDELNTMSALHDSDHSFLENKPIDPEVERLLKEKQKLLDLGVYTEDDDIIVALAQRIDELAGRHCD